MPQLSQDNLQQIGLQFNITPNSFEFIRESANLVYGCDREGKRYILRIAPPEQDRSPALLRTEMAWLGYLAEHGGHVAHPQKTQSGAWVATLDTDEGDYHATLFERIEGEHPDGEKLNESVIMQIGAALGRMHRIGKTYEPVDSSLRRPHWHELSTFQLGKLIPQTEVKAQERWQAIEAELHTLPTDESVYGLIHADAEPWNIFIVDDRLVFIDFDEACYHWIAFELAVSLLYIVLGSFRGDWEKFPQVAWDALAKGYQTENSLNETITAQIPLFLRMRVLQDYAHCLRTFDFDNLEDWEDWMIKWLRDMIEHDTLPFNIAYAIPKL